MKSFPSGWMIPLGGTTPLPFWKGVKVSETSSRVFIIPEPIPPLLYGIDIAPSYSIKKVSPLAKGPQTFEQTNFFSLTKWPRWKWHESCPNEATYRR